MTGERQSRGSDRSGRSVRDDELSSRDTRMPELQTHKDPAAWPKLIQELGVETILVVISSWMSQRIRRHQGVEDIWQEALCMAWRDRDQHEWRGIRQFRAWLLSIARNRFRDAAAWSEAKKRGGTNPATPFSALCHSANGSVSGLLPPGTTTPSRVACHVERVEAMKKALDTLPEPSRQVLWLYLFEERPMPEVADTVGVTLSSARRLFHQGSKVYRARLEQQLGTRVEGRISKR